MHALPLVTTGCNENQYSNADFIRLVISMPALSKHKIMKHGTSAVVVIPKPFRDYSNLKPGDTVTVVYDSILLIVPEGLEYLMVEKAELINQLMGQAKKEDHENS